MYIKHSNYSYCCFIDGIHNVTFVGGGGGGFSLDF